MQAWDRSRGRWERFRAGRPVRPPHRWEWRPADGGDPAAQLEDFLAAHGFAVRDLAATATAPLAPPGRRATLFLSAAAGARLAGAASGAPTPVPDLPDLAVTVTDTATHRGDTAPPPAAGWRLGAWRDSWDRATHAAAVQQVRDAIGRGDVYQVNVVGHASAAYAGDPRPALRRVAALPGARYAGVLHGPGWALGCASPETLVQLAHGQVTTRPIKGTRPATADGREQLRASVKERAEHVMIVDLARNDLARVARTGSVRVQALYALAQWCDLWQAESVVSAAVDDGVGLAALLRAVCPGGSVTGAPKTAALAQIAACEPVGRGAGMGAFGWLGPDGLDLGLTIRTVAVDARRVHVWAGGGVTWRSDPQQEVAEAAAKAAPLRAALRARDAGAPSS